MAKPNDKKSTRKTRAAQKASGVGRRSAHPKHPIILESNLDQSVKRNWWQRTPKSERPVYRKLPNILLLTRKTYELLTINWKLVTSIAIVYGILNILLVRGFNGGLDVSQLKTEFNHLFHGGWGNLASGFAIFGLLVSSSNSTTASDTASAYQTFLVIITSLAFVWTFRQLLADRTPKLRIRDGFYKGMYPLIPLILVFLVIALQLIPALIGGVLYSIVITNGIAVTTPEVIGWFVALILAVVWSLLLITPSVFALCIVTLPDMAPLHALRTARKLVKFRRLTVLRKLLFLPVLLLIVLSIIMLPIILIVPVLAQWTFFALNMFILPTAIAYVYVLYRELLDEQT